MNKMLSLVIAAAFSGFLSACGGGGSSSDATQASVPTVTLAPAPSLDQPPIKTDFFVPTPTISPAPAVDPPSAPAPVPAPVPGPDPTPAPAPAPAPGSITVQDNGNTWLQSGLGSGTSWVNDGIWGAASLVPGTYTGLSGTTYEQASGVSSTLGPNGEITWRMTWKWPTGTTEVKAYPSAIIGAKPGCQNSWITPCGANIKLLDGTFSQITPSGATPNTFFPLQLPLGPLYSSFNYTQNATPTGRGHLSYDLWLQNTPTQCHGWNACGEITHEIMIPLTYWGNYGSHYGGRNPAWYYKDAMIGGRLWHVYHVAPGGGWPWAFTVFEPDGPTALTPGTLDLSEFTNYMSAQGWINGNTWMVSTELGIEPVEGTGDLTVSNYRVWR